MFALQLLSEGGGSHTELVWLFYALAAFMLLAIIVGWLSGLRQQPQSEPARSPAPAQEKENEDDLTLIEGIGPKVVKVLNAAGVHRFNDLAHAKPAEVERILKDAGLQMMNPAGWIEQAQAAAKGDWKKFEKLQKELKGGRRK